MESVKKTIEVVLLAFTDNGKVLLNRRADADREMWEFIEGGLENGETPQDAIQREILEELGYSLSQKGNDLQFIGDLSFEDSRIVANVHFFTAKFPGIEHFSDSDEVFVADLKLFSLDEALELTLLPITREILEKQYVKHNDGDA